MCQINTADISMESADINTSLYVPKQAKVLSQCTNDCELDFSEDSTSSGAETVINENLQTSKDKSSQNQTQSLDITPGLLQPTLTQSIDYDELEKENIMKCLVDRLFNIMDGTV